MGKYSESLLKKRITEPRNKIVVIDDKYISKEDAVYTIKVKEDVKKDTFNFEILNSNKEECYKCQLDKEKNTVTLYDLKDEPLTSIEEHTLADKILYKKDNENVLGTIKIKNSTKAHKYNIEWNNKATRKDEILNLNGSATYRTCGVFYGREKEGAPMICRMSRTELKDSKTEYKYKIEIAPNVDNLFMILLTTYIVYVKEKDDDYVPVFV